MGKMAYSHTVRHSQATKQTLMDKQDNIDCGLQKRQKTMQSVAFSGLSQDVVRMDVSLYSN